LTAAFGAAYGLFPIGWIILNLIFLYHLTVKSGLFAILRGSLSRLAPDPRVQLILIAFSFGAFFEGAAGFGTPVAVTAAILIQLGFKPLAASGLSLIANTAPVAFGALGTPIIALSKVTGISEVALSQMVGRQLPFFSLIIPFWVVWAMAGFRGMLGVWPAALTAGLAFAIPQFLIANFHGPWLVDVAASVSSIAATAWLLKVWQPKEKWELEDSATPLPVEQGTPVPRADGQGRAELEFRAPIGTSGVGAAWVPWILLSVLVFVWGVPSFKRALDRLSAPSFQVAGLHNVVQRAPPIVPKPTADAPTKAEEAIYKLNWLSATGTGILLAAMLAGLIMGFAPVELAKEYVRTLVCVRYSLITIAAMLALGYVTRYSGIDATLGLALARTGRLYPFFGTMLGWLGVALTGSDTASNVLFGSLQTITAAKTGFSATLMAAANSSGGSTTTASLAPAVKNAAIKARLAVAEKVAPLLGGVKPEEVSFDGAKVTGGGKSITWKQACSALPSAGVTGNGEWSSNLAASGVHGACFAEVEVDMETGHVRPIKMVHVQDIGLPLNRLTTESQINGGMIQSLGMALYEGRVMDAKLGKQLNPGFGDYKLPGSLEMPELVPIIDDDDTREAVIGVGEPSIIPSVGALVNAVYSACGVRIRELPITPDKILMALASDRRNS